MQFEKGYLYHIYNQGNNKQKIFFNRENYIFFLKKINTFILPYADILAWALMPNHFHLMVLVNETKLIVTEDGSLEKIVGVAQSHADNKIKYRTLNDSIGIMLRSYTQAINKQRNRTGKLIREKTKAECINCPNGITPSFVFDAMAGSHRINVAIPEKQYPQVCFNYIHQNPVKANLVKNAVDWEFSSAKDYFGLRNGKLINKEVAREYVEVV